MVNMDEAVADSPRHKLAIYLVWTEFEQLSLLNASTASFPEYNTVLHVILILTL